MMLSQAFLAFVRRVNVTPKRMASLLDHLPSWAVRKVSEARLVRTLRHVYRSSPAQRERWHRSGVGLSDLRSPDVLAHIPFTTGGDLVERPEEYLCVPRAELVHVINSSGTKGRPKVIYFTERDMDHQLRMIAASFLRVLRSGRGLVMYSVRNPRWTAPQLIMAGLEKAGMFGVVSGTERDPAEQIDLIRKYHLNLLFTPATYVHRLALETAGDLRRLGVRHIQLGAQPWTEAFRTRMASTWGAAVTDCYGLAESGFGISAECIHQNGLHVAEADFWMEVVDPATGRPLPDGQEGEFVFTTLSRSGMPLVRYRTKDIGHLIERGGRCACGMPLRKMSRVRGRFDDVFIIGVGTNVYPDNVDRVIFSVPEITDYRIVIERESYRDVLRVTVEHEGDPAGVKDAVVKALLSIPEIRDGCEHSRTVVIGGVERVPRGTLSEGLPKSRRIVDRRG